MIPTTGIMVGLYIIARYCEMAAGDVGLAPRILLAILIFITFVCMYLLFQTGTDTAAALNIINSGIGF